MNFAIWTEKTSHPSLCFTKAFVDSGFRYAKNCDVRLAPKAPKARGVLERTRSRTILGAFSYNSSPKSASILFSDFHGFSIKTIQLLGGSPICGNLAIGVDPHRAPVRPCWPRNPWCNFHRWCCWPSLGEDWQLATGDQELLLRSGKDKWEFHSKRIHNYSNHF